MRGLPLVLALGAITACYGLETPPAGIASVTFVLPYPAVVRGDTLRDTSGKVAPLRVVALGPHGDTVRMPASFVVIDTPYHFLHVDGGGFVYGDSVRSAPVRIVGTVGPLQTAQAPLFVTVPPQKLVEDSTVGPDSISQFGGVPIDSLIPGTSRIQVRLLGPGDTTVEHFVVQFQIVHAPPALPGQPPHQSGFLLNNQNKPTTVDTTVAGVAGVRIALNGKGVVPLTAPDSFVVRASARYKGIDVDSARTFVIRITK
jgi:hypothetical protein